MAKNRKNSTTGSKKFIATLPYLVAPSNEQIDQMEVNFYLNQAFQQSHFYPFDFDFDEEDRFLGWMMEIEDAQFDRMSDDYLCLAMERSWRELNTHETKLFHKLERMEDPWFEGGDPNWDLYDPRDDDVFHDYTGPDPDDCRDNCQLHGYADFNYWNEGSDDWDISESQRLFDNSFCPEQAIVREIPLHGLKASVRKELIREYCVH